MKSATWDGLDFAALQMLMVDHRWNGQPGVQMDRRREEVSVLIGRDTGLFLAIQPGQAVEIDDTGSVHVREPDGRLAV